MPVQTRETTGGRNLIPATFTFGREQLAGFDRMAARLKQGKSALMREAMDMLLAKYDNLVQVENVEKEKV